MGPSLGERVAAVLAAPDEKSAKREREALVRDVRALLVTGLRRSGLSASDADDVAQEKVLPVTDRLVESRMQHGNPEGFVRTCARHAAIDTFRKIGRRGETALGDDAAEPGTSDSAGASAAIRAERRELVRIVTDLLTSGKMPGAYREVMRAVYVAGRDVADLAPEELARQSCDKAGRPRSIGQARAVVDQRLTRARRWLRARVMLALAERAAIENPPAERH